MKARMFSLGHYLQIFRAIVCLDAVLMVRFFVALKRAAKCFLQHETMLKFPVFHPISGNSEITFPFPPAFVGSGYSTAFERAMLPLVARCFPIAAPANDAVCKPSSLAGYAPLASATCGVNDDVAAHRSLASAITAASPTSGFSIPSDSLNNNEFSESFSSEVANHAATHREN